MEMVRYSICYCRILVLYTYKATPFFNLVDSNNFLDYANIARVLGLALSTITIIPMYLLSRKFFDVKYSLCATGLFAF